MADDDPPARRRTVTCDFCGSKLTAEGEIIKLGDAAKEYRDSPEVSKKLRAELTAAEATIAELRADVKTLKEGKPAGKGDSGGDDI